jgi:hypothetical protein
MQIQRTKTNKATFTKHPQTPMTINVNNLLNYDKECHQIPTPQKSTKYHKPKNHNTKPKQSI